MNASDALKQSIPCLALVVDDEAQVRKLLRKHLERLGAEVIEAADGEEGWDLFRGHSPDLVVTDVRMPRLDGIGLLARVRSAAPRAEVVVVTGFVETQTLLKALRGGASNFLEKPFQMEDLTRQLSTSLHRCRLAKEADRLAVELTKERRHRELSGRLATMGRLMAGLAHEIHNPLTFLKGNAELVRRLLQNRADAGRPDPGQAEMVGLLNDVEFGARRIEELLAALRRFGGGSNVPEQDIAVADLMASSIRLVAPRRPKRIAFEVALPPADVIVRVRPVEIESCLMNLLVNAFEAVDPVTGSVRFAVEGLDGEAGQLDICVEDNGPGIPPERLEELFTPFITQKRTGMGLGLSIAYDAAARNGAKLEMDTHPGRGTKALVHLPWRKGEPSGETPALARGAL